MPPYKEEQPTFEQLMYRSEDITRDLMNYFCDIEFEPTKQQINEIKILHAQYEMHCRFIGDFKKSMVDRFNKSKKSYDI